MNYTKDEIKTHMTSPIVRINFTGDTQEMLKKALNNEREDCRGLSIRVGGDKASKFNEPKIKRLRNAVGLAIECGIMSEDEVQPWRELYSRLEDIEELLYDMQYDLSDYRQQLEKI